MFSAAGEPALSVIGADALRAESALVATSTMAVKPRLRIEIGRASRAISLPLSSRIIIDKGAVKLMARLRVGAL